MNGNKIIDFHTHPYLNMEQNMCMYKEKLNLTMEESVRDMQNSGITHACGSVIEGRNYDLAKGFAYFRRLNDQALLYQEKNPDFFTPGFHIHPAFVKESLEEIERMHKMGIKLIGELVPYMHCWDACGMTYGSKELTEILSLAGEYDMVVSFHNMTEWADDTEQMIKNNPKVTFVAAHPGQKADYLVHIERMKKYDNAYLDLSGTGLFRYGMVKYGIETIGADRLLFGTDYPITNPRMYVQAVLGESISEQDREKIFYTNAKNILQLQ